MADISFRINCPVRVGSLYIQIILFFFNVRTINPPHYYILNGLRALKQPKDVEGSFSAA